MHSPAFLGGFVRSLRAHRGSVIVAGLLAFSETVTFFAGALSVMREPGAADWPTLAFWWALYGFELWALLLAVGYACQHAMPPAAGRFARGGIWLFSACAVAACVSLTTVGRAEVLIEQGVVQGARTMILYSFIHSLTMTLLYFAHLRRSRMHGAATARLATAQAAQRGARRHIVQTRLAAVQARIDPQLLFEMLDAVQRAYAVDAPRAECLLDELIAFLRSALPRLRTASSSIPREVELARSYARLRTLAGAAKAGMTVDLAASAIHARFPPGVLLPLLDDALRAQPGPCALTATRSTDACRVVMKLSARPSDAVVDRVRSLLADLHGSLATLVVEGAGANTSATIRLPYELA